MLLLTYPAEYSSTGKDTQQSTRAVKSSICPALVIISKLLTPMCLCHQAVQFGTGQRAVMLCGRVGNRIGLASHWPCGTVWSIGGVFISVIFEPPSEVWRIPRGWPRNSWVRTVTNDLANSYTGLPEAREAAQDRVYWRMFTKHSATHS